MDCSKFDVAAYMENLTRVEYPKLVLPEYDDFQWLDLDSNIFRLMRAVQDHIKEPSVDYMQTYTALNELRMFNKFDTGLFQVTFNNCKSEFSKLIENSNPVLERAAMRLVSEIFTKAEDDDDLRTLITKITPLILTKANSENDFLKSEACCVLNVLTENMFFPETFQILLEGVSNSNTNISNISFDYFIRLFINAGDYILYGVYEQFEWEEFLGSLLTLFQKKADRYVKKAYQVLSTIEETLSSIYHPDYLSTITGQINDLEFHAGFEEMNEERNKLLKIYTNKVDYKEKFNTSRKLIKSDKQKSKVNNSRGRGEIVNYENYNPNYNPNENRRLSSSQSMNNIKIFQSNNFN